MGNDELDASSNVRSSTLAAGHSVRRGQGILIKQQSYTSTSGPAMPSDRS